MDMVTIYCVDFNSIEFNLYLITKLTKGSYRHTRSSHTEEI